MQLLNHRCPVCDFVAVAPMPDISSGDAGIWQCENCDRAYRIHIEFLRIAPETLSQKRERIRIDDPDLSAGAGPNDVEALRGENLERDLLEIQLETRRLRQMVRDVAKEAERLKDEKTDPDPPAGEAE